MISDFPQQNYFCARSLKGRNTLGRLANSDFSRTLISQIIAASPDTKIAQMIARRGPFFTSPLVGEVGTHRRYVPGEGSLSAGNLSRLNARIQPLIRRAFHARHLLPQGEK